MKLPLECNGIKRNLEILFLESSRPQAGVNKFIKDWIKLVRMSKRAHNKIFTDINNACNRLQTCDEGKKILDKLSAIPIILIQVHCLDVKIAVLDWRYRVYHRVRVLGHFTIPLTPPEDPETLKDFVCHLLQLVRYVDNVSSRLREIWDEQNCFTRSSTPPQSMSIDPSMLTRTPDTHRYYDVGQRPSMDED